MKNLHIIPDINFRYILKELFPAAFENGLLDVNNNEIINCKELHLSNSHIKDLTGVEYFVNLKDLLCTNNKLTFLPELPATLVRLYCYNNQLTSLPALPAALKELSCHNNQLTSLPALPAALKELDCNNNDFINRSGFYHYYYPQGNLNRIFIDSEKRTFVKQNDKYFSGCLCNKTPREAKELYLEYGYDEAIKYFSL